MRIFPPTVALLPLLPLLPLIFLPTAVIAVGGGASDRTISQKLFGELEEAARLADIAYCVGVSGIWRPFGCLSRCGEFEGFELVDTWNTGPLHSDSCGYIALDHARKRIVVAFRGTYSLASALADLATTPQVYVPYPEVGPPEGDGGGEREGGKRRGWRGWIPWFGRSASSENQRTLIASETTDTPNSASRSKPSAPQPVCTNCTVHAGFLATWLHTRPLLLPHLTRLSTVVPDYEVHMIGHSLGGALAALAGLEVRARGGEVVVTTFGEPRVGNGGLVGYLDDVFGLGEGGDGGEGAGEGGEGKGGVEREGGAFRRVTHAGDPVPLLPLTEWGYAMHGGEIYISSPSLPVEAGDVEMCVGDADEKCIAGSDSSVLDAEIISAAMLRGGDEAAGEHGRRGVADEGEGLAEAKWGVPTRFRAWQLLFAHRDYFWRIGLCVPGGDPGGWGWRLGRGSYGGAVGGEEDGEEKGRVDEL